MSVTRVVDSLSSQLSVFIFGVGVWFVAGERLWIAEMSNDWVASSPPSNGTINDFLCQGSVASLEVAALRGSAEGTV